MSRVLTPLRRFGVLNIFAVAAVLLAYFFFATVGTMRFPLLRAGERHIDDPSADYYARLADAFLSGQTYLNEAPDARLEDVVNPFDPAQREGIMVLWDASYYKGRYYLYWTPLPALLFHIPVRLVTGRYPDDALASTFFASWAFVAAALALHRTFRDRTVNVPLWIGILTLGLGGLTPYTLSLVRVYEVAALCAMAMSATWALALLRFVEERTAAAALWMGAWLGLAIAARPTLALLFLPTLATFYLISGRRALVRTAVGFLVPLFVVGFALAGYNIVRFGNPFELGVRYQLSWISMQGVRFCSLCSVDDVLRLANGAIHYLFWPVRVWTDFPFLEALVARLDPKTSITAGAEHVIGVFVINPLVMIATAAAAILVLAPKRSVGVIGATAILAGGWLVLFGVSTCKYVVYRYSLDFILLMILAALICVEEGFEFLRASNVRVRLLRIAVATLCAYSIIVGILLGFEGPFLAFRRYNPELTEKIAAVFGVRVRPVIPP